MNKKPLVSCIIIFLNAGEKFFVEAIESIFAQTYDNWELLLADDGSTDESTEIALRYAQQYPEKVRYVEHEGHQNRGMSATRNLGIRQAKGEYIAFLDADDIWLTQKLEKQVAILEAQPQTGMVCGPTQYWYSWTGNPEDTLRDSMREIGVLDPNRLYQPPTLLRLLLQNQINAPATCGVLLRKELLEKIGGFEEAFRGLFEDRVFFAKVYLKASVFVSSECWDKYRQHPDSTCSVEEKSGQYNPSGKSPTHLVYLNWMREYLSQQEVNDKQVWKALQMQMQSYQPLNQPLILRLLRKIKRKSKSLFLRLRNFIRLMIFQTSIKHIYGSNNLDYSMNELIVLCVVRNGETYIKSFIEHYFSLGAKHIVFLDNASTDDTIAIARQYSNVSILQTKSPYQKYETIMKKYLVKRFSLNRWNLFADIDELFDYPFSDVLSLSSFLTYLNKNSYTAVVAQMLDMFANGSSFQDLIANKNNSLKEVNSYYDISNISKSTYIWGTLSNQAVKMHYGGIRKSLFSTNNGLTKAPLIFVDNKIKYFVDFHHVENANIADFTCVILHYPFACSFQEKVYEAVQTDRYKESASDEYKMYWKKLMQDKDMIIAQETARKLKSINDLINGFLIVSEKYRQWVKIHEMQKQIPTK
ncbi:glycosyltransferase family 2 protein [Nostoc sphaeroides]|nr:glycosyltransferase [Nostoc sphaeroides]